ncbi:SDR family oxidoreductase [Sphingomonas histidinilytica]|uniref:NAD(P)-dependent dehydrogenase, short-chain alcohol dehydrogenase family n=1 Tax=Rhizorhabdus histidinilytica TaxID=439228 RepID=A0A1T5ENS9_9SPHN|nr:SDR family oxidoreductase [Rhizorhabdus histidinilytica]MBO9376713.1 SDR family oxidoreductase [Rhizorhabdus histidinilytica]SKB85330.1 NAD(P)-dependent dehydrogenase, short-chain alcohol dehydrogenase family [Rhizorhabdus histidinilytica]
MGFRPFDLTGKVSLVTGGNGGIGFGMAAALAQAGSDIVIWGRKADKNAAAAAALRAMGAKVLDIALDISDRAAVDDAMARSVAEMGRVDCFIANAAIGKRGTPFDDIDAATLRDVVAINLEGTIWCLRAAAATMAERARAGDPGGSIIGLSTIATFQGVSRNQAYAATKGAMVPLIRSIAVEYGRHGIRANTITPGWIATDRTAWAREDGGASDAVVRRTPARRWGEPADFGGIAVYLASDASRFHTGDDFVIDGGYSIF